MLTGIYVHTKKIVTIQKVIVHKNRASLQLAILYEMLKDQCEEVNTEGLKVKNLTTSEDSQPMITYDVNL